MKRATSPTGLRSLLLTAVACSLASCAPTLGLEARYGTFDVDGDIGLSSSGFSANNSVDSMGIEDDDSVASVRADLKWGVPHLSLTLQDTTHDGDGTLEGTISGGGVTIPAGTAVHTDLDLGLYTGYLTFDMFPGDWEVGLGFGLVAADLDMKTKDNFGNDISTDELLPIPVIAGRAGVSLGRFDFEALAGAITYDDGSTDVTFFDLDVNGSFRLLGDGDHTTGWLTLGLRYVDLDAKYEDGNENVDADMQFTGPYFGLRAIF